MTQLDQLEIDIRRSVESGEFARSQRLWSAYCAGLREMIAAGTATDGHLRKTRGLMEWVQRSALISRTLCMEELAALQVSNCYIFDAVPAPPGLRVFG